MSLDFQRLLFLGLKTLCLSLFLSFLKHLFNFVRLVKRDLPRELIIDDLTRVDDVSLLSDFLKL